MTASAQILGGEFLIAWMGSVQGVEFGQSFAMVALPRVRNRRDPSGSLVLAERRGNGRRLEGPVGRTAGQGLPGSERAEARAPASTSSTGRSRR